MKRKFITGALSIVMILSYSLPAYADSNSNKGEAVWATRNEGVLTTANYEAHYKGKRDQLSNSIGEADATGQNNVEGTFTSIAYFPKGVTYNFDKKKADGTWEKASLVNNPDTSKPDLTLREITWDGDACSWIGEGVKVYAVNYNGTGKDELIAYAYNKMAEKNIEAYNKKNNTNEVLPQVKGAKVDFEYGETKYKNVYVTNIYFPNEFKYCDAIKVVDITDSIKKYGGGGQDSLDGYDLDAIKGYNLCYNYKPEEEKKETENKTPALENEKENEDIAKDKEIAPKEETTKDSKDTKQTANGEKLDKSPQTGDSTSLHLGLIMMLSAATVMTTTVVIKKRRQ